MRTDVAILNVSDLSTELITVFSWLKITPGVSLPAADKPEALISQHRERERGKRGQTKTKTKKKFLQVSYFAAVSNTGKKNNNNSTIHLRKTEKCTVAKSKPEKEEKHS